jgi:hypothetical protein
MGGVGLMLAMLITSCGGGTAQSAEPQKPDTVSVNAGYDPRIYTEDPWQLGYCVSVENDAAEEHEDGGEYGTGSYADLLSDRPCTLDMAFGYGKILKKHHLVGEHDAGRVWSVLADTEPKFVENVVQFSDGYAENFINR